MEAILVLIFGRQGWFVDALGFFSLGLESTLPIPQLIRFVLPYPNLKELAHSATSNFKQKSLYGFSMLTLLGWLGGDGFK
jgi:solute carrier family 66, member 2